LPHSIFARISKSHIVNIGHLVSCDGQSVYLQNAELPIGNIFKEDFFRDFIERKVVKRQKILLHKINFIAKIIFIAKTNCLKMFRLF
jgi:hypothetical protein